VVATGVSPRDIKLKQEGAGGVNVVNYLDVLKFGAPVGKRVAIIGAGGIGFDVAEFLTHYHPKDAQQQRHQHSFYNDGGAPDPTIDPNWVGEYLQEWNIDPAVSAGGLKNSPLEGAFVHLTVFKRRFA
jgi:hypothetical protein